MFDFIKLFSSGSRSSQSKLTAAAKPMVESLEKRSLLSGTVALDDDGLLEIIGDRRTSNTAEIIAQSDDTLLVELNGQEYEFDLDDVSEILYRGGRRNDRVVIDEGDNEINLPIKLQGGDGQNYLEADVSPVTLIGGKGRDTLLGSLGDDFMFGNDGNDKLYGDDGDDRLYGGKGNDDIRGDAGDDDLRGDAGDDRIDGGRGSDYLRGDRDDDILVDYARGAERNEFIGGYGWDAFYASDRDDIRDFDFFEDDLYLAD